MSQKTNFELITELLEYIDSDISKEFTMEELASKLYLSESRFQKVFSTYMAEPVFKYIKRRKLEISAKRIAYSNHLDEDITQILFDLGFKSKSSFSKMFKSYFGITASDFQKENLKEYESLLIKNANSMKITAEIVQLNTTEILYVKEFGDYSNSSRRAWDRIEQVIEGNDILSDSSEFFGIIHDDETITEKLDCRYDACISKFTSEVDFPEVLVKELPEGKYAKFVHKGSYESLNKTYDSIWSNWYINSSHQIASTPIIEKYLNDPDEVKQSELLTEIYIPIK